MLLRERKAIVTGGPTREWLDPVRFISNPSTGKMGVAIAEACFARARETVFIHGPIDTALLEGKKFRCASVETTEEMRAAVVGEIEENCVLIMAAAPADYTPAKRSATKIKKTGEMLVLEMKKNPDILKHVAAMKVEGSVRNVFTVGFAAETDRIEEYALGKLRDKNLDMICLNDVSRRGAGFGADTNIVTIFHRDGSSIELPMISKREVAARLLDEIESRLPKYLLTC